MAEDFVRSPPDSTGKRIHSKMVNDGVEDIYTQVIMLADRNDPANRQSVDNKGSAKVTFNSGDPDFTAFGRTTVSEANLLAMYKFYQEDYSFLFAKEEVGAGSVGRDVAQNGLMLSTGTASGDKGTYHSHRHFQYRPGNSMPLMWTMKVNDPGTKANLTRKAGWFGNEGTTEVVLEMDSTGVYACLLDSVMGVSEKVEKSSWNGDRLDGTGGDNNLSGETLNPQATSIWWIDFQFLGSGAIRFGTFVNGEKVVCHTLGNYGSVTKTWAQNASFSFGVTQENTGVVSSTSEMVVYCAVVVNDGYDEFDKNVVNFSTTKAILTDTFAPIISYRPTQLKGVLDNRDRVLPTLVSVHTETSTIELVSELNTPLTGATFANSISNTEYDTAATATSGIGQRKIGQFVGAGRSEATDLSDAFPIQTSGINRHYDSSSSDHVTIFARLAKNGAAATDVSISITVAEVQ